MCDHQRWIDIAVLNAFQQRPHVAVHMAHCRQEMNRNLDLGASSTRALTGSPYP
jgi:hypothetical protein